MFEETFLTSDLHFWHKNVIDFCNRPWANVEDMNHGLITLWNSVVGKRDRVLILGDMFFCGSQKIKEIMPQLNGYKELYLGNHDWGKIKAPRAAEFGFSNVLTSGRIETQDVTFNLSHFPYTGDHMEEERFKEHRLPDDGNWLLHGHVHTLWKVRGKQINVGVDVWNWKPVHLDELIKLAKENS